ncbi:ADP-ribosylglycohydrolase family protein [Pseudovibrio sp. Tun.PSC04-5.I4]|uniref:ADP-ribosylglycohydrolase family protein n=1 Tax=Pseudovibrio sp. Tun.PSC04-5.I4 TaxID=1798213 RepID=UPI000AE2DB01|nr:ADP-ribosylglycohydrolase family protein [Pseudovibrio sp. Tun.PSC04-5.I4]
MLSLLHTPENITDALVQSANELESDTDTIATMAGALLGALTKHEPTWKIQDLGYLKSEAHRMADIARGADAISFSYQMFLSGNHQQTNQMLLFCGKMCSHLPVLVSWRFMKRISFWKLGLAMVLSTLWAKCASKEACENLLICK